MGLCWQSNALLFNMLSRLAISFLPRSKHLLILWLQSPSAVILEPKKIKSDTVSTVSPSICYEVMGPDPMILVFWGVSIFLKGSLVFPILFFSSIFLHWSFRKAFLSLLALLWNSVFRWIYLSFSPLPFASLVLSAICKSSVDNHFAF